MDRPDNRDVFWEAERQRFVPDVAPALANGSEYMCCAVCHVLADLPFEYFRLLPKRWTEEPDAKEAVCRAGGFCHHHTWRLNKIQSQVIMATIYADVLAWVSQTDGTLDPCPVCRLQALAETALLNELVRSLSDPAARERYGRLFGLCYTHYRQVMARDLDANVRETIRRAQEEHNEWLIGLLHAHIDKNEVPARWSRSEAENRAPRWALLKTVGNEDL